MFNVTSFQDNSETLEVTRVVEKSITPDKVVDMYDNVKEEYEKQFLAAYKIESNYINAVVATYQDINDNSIMVIAEIKINKENYILKNKVYPEQLFARNLDEEILALVYNFYIKKVTDILAQETLKVLPL